MTKNEHRLYLIDMISNEREGARDYYLKDEDRKVIVVALEKSNRDCVDCANFDGEYAECTVWNKTVVSVGCRYWDEVNEDD